MKTVGFLRNRIQKRIFGFLAGILLIAIAFALTQPAKQADALSGFNPANIIDDGVFTSKNSLSTPQIQAFLNGKVSSCDTNGTLPAAEFGRSDLTHAQYAASRGWSAPPYTCLKDYVETGKSSAQIIYDAAQEFSINPQILIVLLQKEQSLVTDTWPLSSQYRTATGYGCPDTAPCDSQYFGLTNQIRWAARMFRAIIDDSPTWYTPYELGNNYIQYSPDSNCGGSVVNIQNRATQALYNYTPYQPNQAALDAGWGTAPCGAYGNRNFYLYFTSWFDPYTNLANNLVMTTITQPDLTPARGQDVTYTVSYKNNLNYAVTLDAIGIVGRLNDVYTGASRDFGWQGPSTIQPGASQQFSFTTNIKDVGAVYAWPAVSYQGRYLHFNNWGVAMNSHQANISVASPLTITPSNPVAGEPVTLSATVRNNEDQPLRIDALGIPVRYYGQYNYDVAWTTASSSLGAGASQVLSGTTTFDKPGPYTAWVSWNASGQYTTLSPIESRTVNAPSPDFTMTYLETPNTSPAVGEDVVVKFKLKNNLSVPLTLSAVGVVGRYGNPYNGPNRDFGWVGPETFAAGQEKSYTTFVSTVSKTDNFYAWVAINYNGAYTHYNNWGFVLSPHLPNLSLSPPLTINSGSPVNIGQTVPITATIKNNEPRPIRYSALGIPIRYYGTYNYDTGWIGSGILAASGQAGDTQALSGSVKFDKSGPYTIWASANIGGYITIGTPQALNL